jgi:hypothetical protein
MKIEHSQEILASDGSGQSRSSFEDAMLMFFYAAAVTTAMAGWLWFLAWLALDLWTWIVR